MNPHSRSLNMRFWPRRETLLRPGLWSSEDLRLFGCQFSPLNTSHQPDPVATPVEDGGTDEAWELLRSFSKTLKRRYLQRILARDRRYRRYSSRIAPFRIGKRFSYTVPYDLFLPAKPHHQARGDLPVTAYIDHFNMTYERAQANKCRRKPGMPRDGYDDNYFERYKQLTPKDWTADPYILCILLSLAQYQYYEKNTPRKSAYQACLLLSHNMYRREIYFFAATISTALLDQLDDPRICPKQPTPLIVINRTLMNVEPARDFGARVVAALASYGSAHDGGDSKDDGGDSKDDGGDSKDDCGDSKDDDGDSKDDDDSRGSGNSSSSETQRGI